MAKLNTDSATKLYNAVKDAGYDIGDYNAYMTKLQSDPTNADNLYKALHGAGFDIGNDYASKLYSNATPIPNLFDFGKKPDVTIPNAGNGYSFLDGRQTTDDRRRTTDNRQQTTVPLSDNEAKKAIYGNIPGTTKIGDVSFLPTGGGYQNTKGKAPVQKPNTDVQVAVPGQSVYGKTPQLRIPTITSEDIEKQDEEILLPPEDLERIAKMRTPGKFDREREMAIKNYEADKEEQRLKEYYKSPEGRNEYNAHINYLNKAQELVNKADADLKQREIAFEQKRSKLYSPFYSGSEQEYIDNDRQKNVLDLERSKIEEAKNAFSAYKQGKYDGTLKQILGTVQREGGNTLEDIASFGVAPLLRDLKYKQIADKKSRGEHLTDDESKVLNTASMAKYVSDTFGERTFTQEATSGILQSLPYMASFIASDGLLSGISKGISKGVEKAGFKSVTKAGIKEAGQLGVKGLEGGISKNLARSLGAVNDVVDATTKMAIFTAIDPRTYDKAIQNMNGDAGYDINEKGNIVYTGQKDSMDFTSALTNAYISQGIENLSEAAGEGFKPLSKAFSSVLSKTTPDLARVLKNNKFFTWTGDLAEKAKFNGTLGEFMEEQIATVGHSLAGDGQGQWSDLIDPRQQLLTLVTVMAVGSGGWVANQAGNTIQKLAITKEKNISEKEFDSFFGADGNELKNIFNTAPVGVQQDLIKTILQDENVDENAKKAAYNYYVANTRYQSYKGTNDQKIDDATADATNFVGAITHAESGNVIEARLHGVDKPINITKGNVVLKEDGSVDMENSDKTFFYKTPDGVLHVGNIEFIEGINSVVPAQEAIDKSVQPVREQLENENAPEYGIGKKAVVVDNTDPQNPSNAIVTITGRDENGNYKVQRDMGNGQVQPGIVQPREILPQFAGVLDTENAAVDYIDPQTGETMTGMLELDTPDKQMMFANGYATIDGKQISFENVIQSQEPRAKSQEVDNGQLTVDNEKQNVDETNGLQAAKAGDAQGELGQGGFGASVQESADTQTQAGSEQNGQLTVDNGQLTEIPVDDKGNLLFEQARPELTMQFLKDNFEPEEIVPTVVARINAINKEISKQEAFKPTGNIQKDALTKQAKREALNALNGQLGYWKDIQEQVTPRNYKPQNETIAQRDVRWGEPTSMREMIIRKFIGGVKLRWDDETSADGTVISRGLGGEYRYSNDERKAHFNFIAANGVTPEQLAHALWQANAYEAGQFEDMPLYGTDTQEILNEILDVMNSYKSVGDMIKSVDEIRDRYNEQEQAYIDALVSNEENQKNVLETVQNEMDDATFAQISGVVDLTEEQQNELKNLQNDDTNRRTTETTIGSDSATGSQQPGEASTGVGTSIANGAADAGGNNAGDRGTTTVDQSTVNSQQSAPQPPNGGLNSQAEIDTQELDANIASQEHNTNPTEKQKETGIYPKARVNLQGFNITLETLKGTERSGIDEGGQKWSVTMNNHYGELDGTTGYDGDPIDVFIGPNPKEGGIFVVDQTASHSPSGLPLTPSQGGGQDRAFDESKVMLGFDSAEEAKAAYMSNYEPGWDGFGAITPAGDNFKEWLYDGKKQRKPFSEYVGTPEAVDNGQLTVSSEEKVTPIQKQEQKISELESKLFDLKLENNSKLFGGQNGSKGASFRSQSSSADKKEQTLKDRIEKEKSKLEEMKNALSSSDNEERAAFQIIEKENADKQYFAAIERGDMETAQRIIDQQAVKNGYVSKEDYRLSHRAPSADTTPSQEKMDSGGDFNLVEIANGYSNQPSDYFDVRNGARWYGYDYYSGRQSQSAINSAIRAIKAGENPTVTIYRAVEKSLKENEIRNGDWVTLSSQYAKEHGQQHIDGPYRIISQEVPAENVWWDGNDINEWGYDDGKEYAYKNTKNNRKLTDVIVRDDNGEIIPPSKRFNQRIADIRFQLNTKQFDTAKTPEEKYISGKAIIDQLDVESSRETLVAKDNKDFAAMLPDDYEELIMTEDIGGVFFKGGVIINIEKHDTTDSIKAAYEHEYAHKATREIHSREQLAELWVNSSESDKRLLRSAYANNTDFVKGDELISLAVEDIIKKQGYENYKLGNIDLSSYSETLQKPLKQTIEYANKEYLDNLQRRDGGRGTLSGDNAGEKTGDLRNAGGGRSASALGREDNGVTVQSPSDVSGAVSGGSEGVLQSPLNPPQGDLLPATIEVDGVERSTSNSLGQPIHPTEAGVRNFWKWFGNSKVVDKQDRPLVVYHGSISDFNEFKLIDSDVFGTKFGHFFTPDKDIAQIFADRAENGVLYATYLKLEHPKKINGFFWDSYSRYKGADASLRKQSPKEYKAGVELPDFKKFREQLQAEGNDGVVLNNISIQGEKTRIVKTPQYIVFDARQIKSATGNNGEFGAYDADIRYQIIGEKGATALDNTSSMIHDSDERGGKYGYAKINYPELASKDEKLLADYSGFLMDRLKKFGKKPIVHYTKADWDKIGIAEFRGPNRSLYGGFMSIDKSTGQIDIYINPYSSQNKKFTFMHEATHAYTVEVLSNPKTTTELKFKKDIESYYNDFVSVYKSANDFEEYQVSNLEEFLAYAFSDSVFQKKLNSIKTSSKKTFLAKLWDIIKGLFVRSEKDSTLLDDVINTTIDYIEKADYSGRITTQKISFQIIGEKGAKALDASTSSATEATSRLDNLRVAKEMENGKSIENGRLKFFDEIPDELKNDARIVNRGEDTDGEAMKRIQANPQAKAAWVDYVKSQKDLIEWNNLPKNEQAKRIRLATGWEKGVDGLWRYEVPDGEFAYGYYDLIQKGGMKRLQDVFENTEIFKAYPELNNIAVMTDNLGDMSGSYSNKVITLNRDMFGRVDMLSVLIHEIQHAIQDIEGFAKGGNVNTDTDTNAFESYNYNSREAKAILQAKQEFENSDAAKEINASKDDITKWMRLLAERNKSNEDWKAISKAESLFYKETGMRSEDYLKKYPSFEKYAFEQYKNIAGEAEARNASARMNMNEEERRNTLLAETADVAPEDQIVLMNGLGVSESRPITPKGEQESGFGDKDDSRGGVYNSPEYKTANKVQRILKLRGIDKPFSVSDTDYGKSMYFTVNGDNGEPKLKIRISDHSVSNYDRIFKEQHESSKSDPVRIANDIELAMYPERYNKIQTGVRYYSKYDNSWITEPVEDGKAWVKSYNDQATEKYLDGLNPEKTRIVSKEFVKESKAGNKIYKVVLENLTNVGEVPTYRYERKEEAPVLNETGDADIRFQIQAPKSPKGDLPATIKVDGVERPTTNSNGKPIHGTEEGIRNFWKWFGDSKVVDKDGRPLVYWHGSSSTFTSFDTKSFLSGEGAMGYGVGFYFTPNKSTALNYAERAVFNNKIRNNFNSKVNAYPVYLSAKNLLYWEKELNNVNRQIISKALKLNLPQNITGEKVYKVLSNKMGGIKASEFLNKIGINGIVHITKDTTLGGFGTKIHGNSFQEKGEKQIIIFSPTQIKSATGNTGEFDPEDADIRFQIQTPNPQMGAKYKGSRTTPEYYKQAQTLDDLFGIGKPVHDKKGGEPISEYYKRVKAWSVANNPQAWGEADRKEVEDYLAGITPDSYEDKAQQAQAAAQAAGATVVDTPKPVFQQDGHTMENVTDFARRVVAWREQRFINGIVRAEREAEAREAVAEGFTPMDHEIARMELDMQLRTVYDSLGKLIGKQSAKKLEQRAGNKEMWADSLLPVKTFLDYMRSRGVKIPDIDDYYLQATALQGKNDTGFNNYVRKYQKPVNKWIHDTMKATGFNYRDIENYVFLKHGVERNDYFKQDGKHQKADYAGVYAIATELYAKDNGIPFDPKEKNEIGKVLKEYANAKGITLKETTESGIYDELFANKKEAVEQAQVDINRAFFDKIVTDYISNFESESNSKGRSIDDFWAKLNDANNFSLDVMADAGIITRTQADEIKSRYQYFIPLRGHEVEAEKTYEYSPDAGVFFSNPAIKAHGRISRAEHPFSYIAQMAQSAVVMKNNNDLKKTMLRLARKDKTGLFSVNKTWYIKTGTDAEGKDIWEEAEIEAKPSDELNRAEWEAWNERMKELEKEGRAKQFTKGVDLDGLFIKKKQKKQHAITVIENGEEYQVYINANPRISRAINGLNKSKQSKEMQFLSSIKGTIGLNMTSRNPAFMAANFSRDVIFASSILPAKEGGAYAAQFIANIPIAAKELIQYQINPDNAPQHVQEFLDNGGETGYSHLWELQDMQKQIDKAVAQGMSVSKAWDALVMPIDVMNKIVENTTRLAVYKTSRESGRTVERSVSDAKEVSLNFNRTGAGGGIVDYVRGAYLFVNAGVQAMSNFTKVYKEHPWKMTAVVMSYMMSGLLMSLINGMLLQLSGDDEDEYWNLPEYERQNNLCIWVGNGFVKIPLPQELRVFHRMGDNVAAHLWNKKPMSEAMVNVGAGFLDLIPANPSGPITDSWAEGMPDAVKPFFQVWANKTFTGAAIAKDESFMKAGVPQWRQVRTNRANEPKAPAGIIRLSAELNAALGGDQYRSAGAFEKAVLNPDKLNHLARGYFGGVYTTATQGLGTITDRFYMPEKDLEEKTTGGNLQNAYNKIDKAEQRVNQFNQIVEDLKQNKIDRVQFAKDTLGTNYGEAKRIQKLGSRLREINKVLKENQDLPEEEKKQLLEAQKTILKMIEDL